MCEISSEVLNYLVYAPPTILVKPDAPKFTIIYANPAYHRATLTTPDDIVGLGFLEAFPESPEDVDGDGVEVLRESLLECVNSKQRIELPGKRYDVPIRGTNQFETKYWQASNNPVFNENGDIEYISHVTVEITGAYELARKERIAREVTEAKRRDLHSLLMEAPAAIAILDGQDFVYEFENAIHRNLFAGRELLGRRFAEALPEKHSTFMPILNAVYNTGESCEQNEVLIRMQRNENELHEHQYWNFIYKPRYNAESKIDGIVIFGYQVSEQVMSRKKVEESEKRLQTILETMAEGICIVNRDGGIGYVNLMAERLIGADKERIMQYSYHDERWQTEKVDGTPLMKEEHPIYVSIKTGKPVFDCEIGVKTGDGQRSFISVNAAPLKDDNGTITGAIATFMDVTQRRKSARMKDEFISTVSHELKTPVTSIKAYLQILDRSLTEAGQLNNRHLLDRLGVQINRLESLIKDFLDVTRIDADKLHLRAEEFDMDLVLSELIGDLQLVIPTHQLVITHNQPLKVFTDQNRLSQVLTNLITNAVKYSPGTAEVHIALESRDGQMICSIQDFGIGISESQKELVFDRFHQAGSNRGAGLSLGLGLYISKEIMHKAGGKIWFESQPGKGTTFYISLPVSG